MDEARTLPKFWVRYTDHIEERYTTWAYGWMGQVKARGQGRDMRAAAEAVRESLAEQER